MTMRHSLARLRTLALVAAVSAGALVGAPLTLPPGATAQGSPIKQAAEGHLRVASFRTPAGVKRTLPAISGGAVTAAGSVLAADSSQDLRQDEADAATGGDAGVIDLSADKAPKELPSCSRRTSAGNVRVNQDCGFRRQAEELIKVNPVDSLNLIAGQNDSRIGFNHCGFAFSADGGLTWGDGLPPFFQRLNSPPKGHTLGGGAGTLHTYDAASDPALAFDSRGNAFFSCVLFDVTSDASAVLVTSSPAAAHGAFYNNVPATGSQFVVVEDNNGSFFHDKEFIAADSFVASPFRDNVYVTWTVFEFNLQRCPALQGFCSSRIFFSRSTDHAVTWSPPQAISGNNPDLCFAGNLSDRTRDAHDCDFDQGSDPAVLPDGTIVVVFNNANTPIGSPNGQQLAVVSKDGGLTWSRPSKVGDDTLVDEPVCDFGRGPEECIPGAFIRTNDFPRIAVDKTNGDVYATWQDYRNGEFDVVLSRSADGGKTWQEAAKPVNPTAGLDHYMPAIDVGDNHRVAVSYFRTGRIPNENTAPATGFTPGRDAGTQSMMTDVVVAGGKGMNASFRDVPVARPFPAPDGDQAGFNGDYAGIVAIHNRAIPIWSDTRNAVATSRGITHDEDIFIALLDIPDGG